MNAPALIISGICKTIQGSGVSLHFIPGQQISGFLFFFPFFLFFGEMGFLNEKCLKSTKGTIQPQL